MKKYLISILTSNDINILEITINCALNQLYKNFDVYIIVNTLDELYEENVKQLCDKKFKDKIKKIIKTKSNGKPGMGYNSVLQEFNKTSYEYLLICDGDDFFYPTTLSRVEFLLTKNNYDTISLAGNPTKIYIENQCSCKDFRDQYNNKKFLWIRGVNIERNVVSYLSEDFNNTIATPFRLFVISKNFSEKNDKIYDTDCKCYADYSGFLKTYYHYVNKNYSICFISDPYMYMYNYSSLTSISHNNIKELDDVNIIKSKYDLKNLDVSKINIKVNDQLTIIEKEHVEEFDKKINKLYFNYHIEK
jgi:hypothetical protein